MRVRESWRPCRRRGRPPPPKERWVAGASFAWLAEEQKERAQALFQQLHQHGADSLSDGDRRFCEGIELLPTSGSGSAWHRQTPLGDGGAQLILSRARASKWTDLPRTLHRVDAVMGVEMPRAELAALQKWSRRPMSPGEVGIVCSNERAWKHALDAGWDWSLVLEDDASTPGLRGGVLQLLAFLPAIIASATAQVRKSMSSGGKVLEARDASH